jgi:putative hydroxymethylpyrimidine transporter CytX
MAHTGAVNGLPTMVLTRAAFGLRGSQVLSFFNVLQLVGWTGFMLFVTTGYIDSLCSIIGLPTIADAPAMRYVWVVLAGALCLVWALYFGNSPGWKWIERVSGLLLLALTIAMTCLVWKQTPLLLDYGKPSLLGVLSGMDLVIAMSVSWLPLVADYSRYAVSPRAAARGTFWGYFIGGTWMYAVGLMVSVYELTSMTGSSTLQTPDVIVIEALGSGGAGWAVVAIALVLLSTVTTTFLDIYSTSISAQNLWPGISEKPAHLVNTLLGAGVALLLSVEAYEPFLLAIGGIFLPAFSIVIADYWLIRRTCNIPSSIAKGLRWQAALAWLAGAFVYDWAGGFTALLYWTNLLLKLLGQGAVNPPLKAWPCGASLCCIAVSVGLYWLLSLLTHKRQPAAVV